MQRLSSLVRDIKITDWVNINQLLGALVATLPILIFSLLKRDDFYLSGCVIATAFFYIFAVEEQWWKVGVVIGISYCYMLAFLYWGAISIVVYYGLIISVSFLPVILRVATIKKSSGLYAVVAILFFSMPIIEQPVQHNLTDFHLLFIVSTLPAGLLFLCTQRYKRVTDERVDIPWRENLAECLALAMSLAVSMLAVISVGQPVTPMLIWSCLVINSCQFSFAKNKFLDRFLPGITGVVIGYCLGFWVQGNSVIFYLASLLTLLSLVAAKQYRSGFFLRCVCFPLSICAASQSDGVILERVFDIILGGTLGLFAVFVCHRLCKVK